MQRPTSHAAGPSPALLFETINAYQRSAALKAAIELGIFTAVGEGSATVPELAARCQASERGVRILCDYLVILGFLAKENQRYGLTDDSAAFLDRRSPAYAGGVIEFLLAPELSEAFRDLTTVVRTGTTTLAGVGTVEPDHPIWVRFARAMAPLMAPAAREILDLVPCEPARSLRILDIAAGHGLFGIAFAQRYPQAEVVALDWPAVLQVATDNARAAGIAGRYHPLPGDAFQADFGAGYDLVLLANFLHHFDQDTCVTLLEKVHASLTPGGRAVTLEFVPSEDRVSPPLVAAFSLTMLGATAAGDAYTFRELDEMFRRAGFARSDIYSLQRSIQQVIVSRRHH